MCGAGSKVNCRLVIWFRDLGGGSGVTRASERKWKGFGEMRGGKVLGRVGVRRLRWFYFCETEVQVM